MVLSKKLFIGHCAEFNVGGGVIQDKFSAPCNTTFPKCHSFYNSSDAYKCKYMLNCAR